MRRFAMLSSVLLGVAALGACEADGGVAGPNRGAPFIFRGPSASLVDTVVVGSWSRTISAIDETGSPRSNETIWTFNADGSAARSTITRDALGGIIERQDALGRWTVQGEQVVIDLTSPIAGRVQLSFVRQGETLVLGGQTFQRRV